MDIKYKVIKLKDNNTEEIKDSVSIEEPLEMILKFMKSGKWQTENISITMRTPGNDEDLIAGFLYNEKIVDNIEQIKKTPNSVLYVNRVKELIVIIEKRPAVKALIVILFFML